MNSYKLKISFSSHALLFFYSVAKAMQEKNALPDRKNKIGSIQFHSL